MYFEIELSRLITPEVLQTLDKPMIIDCTYESFRRSSTFVKFNCVCIATFGSSCSNLGKFGFAQTYVSDRPERSRRDKDIAVERLDQVVKLLVFLC